ncbi:hypothetical protein LXA43DRAFT_1066949 [Ganoderma leucocontextum]|nr:hypothetical protein LXA43DRAFT_1066949 [Ganoderma leucocontextum]
MSLGQLQPTKTARETALQIYAKNQVLELFKSPSATFWEGVNILLLFTARWSRKLPPHPLINSEDDIIQDSGSPPSAAPTITQGQGGGCEDDNDSIQDSDSLPLLLLLPRAVAVVMVVLVLKVMGLHLCALHGLPKTHITYHRAPVKAESDGDDSVEVKPSKRMLDKILANEDEEAKDIVKDDVVLPVKCGHDHSAKTVKSGLMGCSPEVVPSKDDKEPVLRKTKSSSKPHISHKAQETLQKTPPKRVVKDKQPTLEADVHHPDSRPSVMRKLKVTRVRKDEEDVVSPESLSPCKPSTPHRSCTKSTSQKQLAIIHSSSEDNNEEEAHASLTKSSARVVGFGQAKVIITTKLKHFKPTPIGTNVNKCNQGDKSWTTMKASKAPDSASDFFNTSPTMVPKNSKGLFFDEESDNFQEDSLSQMLTSNDDDDVVEYVAFKKANKPHVPTPGTDLEDTAAMQMNDISLLTPQKGRKQATSKNGKEELHLYPSFADLVDLKKHPEHAKQLPVLKLFSSIEIDFGSYLFWTGDVNLTVLDVINYKMHPAGLIYTLNLSGLYDQGIINPARSNPDNMTTITSSPTTQRILVVLHRTGPRRTITFTIGIVLKCNIWKDTPSFNGSTQQVRQIILDLLERPAVRSRHAIACWKALAQGFPAVPRA